MKEYRTTLQANLKGTLFDIEATDDYPFSVGYVSGDLLRIVQLEDDGVAEREQIAAELAQVANLPRPFYAYEASACARWLGGPVEHDLAAVWEQVVEEFRPSWTRWCDQCGWIYKWDNAGQCSYCGGQVRDILRELQPRPTAFVPRGLGPAGKNGGTIRWWQEYLRTKNPASLFVVAMKNQADLLAGSSLVIWRAMGLVPPRD